jgi:putative ABC transport system permease protein
VPRMYHPHRLIRLDEGGGAPFRPSSPDAYRVSSARVGPRFFDVVRAPTLAGRTFHSGDYVPDSAGGPVIVNQSFIRLVLGNRNPIGRRFKYIQFEERSPRRVADIDKAPWYEIVGVVRDMGMAMGNDAKVAGIYHPAPNGSVYPASVAIHVKGDPTTFGPKLQTIAAATDPSLRLNAVLPMNRLNDAELEFYEFWFRMLIGVSGVAFVLSLAGIYAVMAFTVARRTREIGVRVALGASARSVLVTIFRRPLIQVASGVVAGAMILVGLASMASDGVPKPQFVFAIAICTLLTFVVCLTACIVPTRRALRVQPTVALRAED